MGSSTRCTLLLFVGRRIGFTLATHATSVMSPSEASARLLTNDDRCYRGLNLLLWKAARGGCGQVVTWEMSVAVVIFFG